LRKAQWGIVGTGRYRSPNLHHKFPAFNYY